jgi:hypothetical protein
LIPKGVPQGSPLSPLLSNYYLDGFDRRLRASGIQFLRYADDFLVLARTPFDLAEARQKVEESLKELNLTLSVEKTQTTTFEQWFRFLGAEIQGDSILLPFDKKKGKMEVLVAPVMPPALVRAYKTGNLKAIRPFEWKQRQLKKQEQSASNVPSPHANALNRLSGSRQQEESQRLDTLSGSNDAGGLQTLRRCIP